MTDVLKHADSYAYLLPSDMIKPFLVFNFFNEPRKFYASREGYKAGHHMLLWYPKNNSYFAEGMNRMINRAHAMYITKYNAELNGLELNYRLSQYEARGQAGTLIELKHFVFTFALFFFGFFLASLACLYEIAKGSSREMLTKTEGKKNMIG